MILLIENPSIAKEKPIIFEVNMIAIKFIPLITFLLTVYFLKTKRISSYKITHSSRMDLKKEDHPRIYWFFIIILIILTISLIYSINMVSPYF